MPEDLGAWRKRERERLIAARLALSPAARHAAESEIARTLIGHVGTANPGVVAGYWPHRGEPSVHRVMLRIIDLGGAVVLPAPIGPRQPLEFREWAPHSKMTAGLGDIPVPAYGRPLRPDLLIIPLVGFDACGFRLGYGAGYYDRTLAALSPRPPTIGVGFELGRLPDFRPQAHDVPLDLIVTEAGLMKTKR
jgi:5,10-methenyltetrahydrofolate synthetase